MKRILYYSILAILATVVFNSCTKDRVNDDNSYWLSQERGNVVYSNNSCGYYVVETNYGYTVIQNLDGLRTYEGDVMYGNFANYGSRSFYNYSANVITRGNLVEADLSYNAAQDAIDYYCPYGKSTGLKIKETNTAESKISRPATSVNQ
jgi:hypothetical protein